MLATITNKGREFQPDWVSPPGDTIAEHLGERGWTQAELATRTGYTEKHVSQLIAGEVSLTDDAAERLARVLGPSMEFWLTLEAQYQARRRRQSPRPLSAEERAWLKRLPARELQKVGALPVMRHSARTEGILFEGALQFFGVARVSDWRNRYGALNVNFRGHWKTKPATEKIAAWLRLGELIAEQTHLDSRYSPAKFKQALRAARTLTLSDDLQTLTRLCADAGVLLALVPALPGARVSGAARWTAGRRPLIQLSFFGNYSDRFWFSFFHEAAHILLHAGDPALVYLDSDPAGGASELHEREADRWAADWLIPPAMQSELFTLKTAPAVRKFAAKLGLDPGLVVGRLQYEKRLPWNSPLNRLKRKLREK
jgi:HTH-type transcriptional regulator/antitoxin HigA